MKPPQVSVLVPVYKVENFIERCARSLFTQTFEDLEYIFVDDGSPDRSLARLENVVEEFPEKKDRVKILRHEHNQGIASVRNTLIGQATGEYTLFVDSDDWIEAPMIECLYRKAREEEADIVACDFFINETDREIPVHEAYTLDREIQLKNIISLKVKAYLWKLLVKRELYTANGIKFPKGIHIGEDDVVCTELYYYAQKIGFVPDTLYHYVQYNPSRYTVPSLGNIEQFLEAAMAIRRFCEQKGIFLSVEKEWQGRIFITKNRFLMDRQLKDYRKWARIHPEANYAWRQYSFSKGQKLIYWLAERHAFGCIRLIKALGNLFS